MQVRIFDWVKAQDSLNGWLPDTVEIISAAGVGYVIEAGTKFRIFAPMQPGSQGSSKLAVVFFRKEGHLGFKQSGYVRGAGGVRFSRSGAQLSSVSS